MQRMFANHNFSHKNDILGFVERIVFIYLNKWRLRYLSRRKEKGKNQLEFREEDDQFLIVRFISESVIEFVKCNGFGVRDFEF